MVALIRAIMLCLVLWFAQGGVARADDAVPEVVAQAQFGFPATPGSYAFTGHSADPMASCKGFVYGFYDGWAVQSVDKVEQASPDNYHHFACYWTNILGMQRVEGIERGCPTDTYMTSSGACYIVNRVRYLPCPQCDAAKPVSTPGDPEAGDPTDVLTGELVERANDYKSADGLFRVDRTYRSRSVRFGQFALRNPPNFGTNWEGILPGHLTIQNASDNPHVEYLPATGGRHELLSNDVTDATSFQFTDFYVSNGVTKYGRLKLVLEQPTTLTRSQFASQHVDFAATAEMRLIFPDGSYELYRRAPDPLLGTRPMLLLQHVDRSGYTSTYDYNAGSDAPYQIRDSFGRSMQIEWLDVSLIDSTVGAAPRSSFDSVASYKSVKSITLPDTTKLTYDYEDVDIWLGGAPLPITEKKARLAGFKRVDAAGNVLSAKSYTYDKWRVYALTGIVDQNGQRLSTVKYGDSIYHDGAWVPQPSKPIYTATAIGGGGIPVSTTIIVDYSQLSAKVSSSELAGGVLHHEFRYDQVDPVARKGVVTNPLGWTDLYEYYGSGGDQGSYMRPVRLNHIHGSAPGMTATDRYFTYQDANLVGTTNARGVVTQMPLEGDGSLGRPASVTEAASTAAQRTTQNAWDATYDLPTDQSLPGRTVHYTYDAQKRLTQVTETDTTTATVPYSTAGTTRTTAYTWTPEGRLLTITGPRAPIGGQGDVTTFAYETSGNLTSVTNALGQATQFSNFSANGYFRTSSDPNGAQTTVVYDLLDRPTAITVHDPASSANNATTALEYDTEGRVVGVTAPGTGRMAMTYDLAGRLTRVAASDGAHIDYKYDAMNNLLAQDVYRVDGTRARGVIQTFDALGRLLTRTLGLSRTTRFSYDANGNPVTVTAPIGATATHAFDPLDRLVSRVAPEAGTVTEAHDAQDNVVTHTDAIGVATQFVRNGFGEVIQEASPDRGTSTYYYDAAGDLTRSIDGRGQQIDYTRDILGRVTTKTPAGRPASEVITYQWDAGGLAGSYGIGRLGAIVDGSGTTQFRYDHRGNVLAQQQTIGSTTAQLAFTYDLGNRVTQVSYPSGRMVQYGYDAQGRVNQVQTKASSSSGSWTTLANGYAYEAFGPVKAMQLGNGLAVANDWGNDGRLAARRLTRTSDSTNLSSLAYGYDPNDNIASITDQLTDANSVYYGYDAADRLKTATLTTTSPGASTETASYTTGTNQLASITNAAGTRTLAYDARGNLASESRPGSVSVATTYDGYGRLTGYTRDDVGARTFVYNGRDDRVAMTSNIDTRRFVYAADGRVMGEYGASASDVKAEFIWATPDAANDNASDGTGGYAPLAVATPDSTGTIQINWVHGNHLGVPLVTTDATGNAATTPNDYLAPGYPGQSRTLADLYYNRYRDYDPSTGRYIQADPIGLAGGNNPYLYAGANPVNRFDASGLFIEDFGIGEAALALRLYCGRFPGQCAAAAAAIGGAIANAIHPPIAPNINPPVPVPQSNNPPISDYCPKDLCEQLAFAEAKAGAGTTIMSHLGDEPRLIAHYGRGPWVKRQHKHICPDGKIIVIHYFSNGRGQNVELKPV